MSELSQKALEIAVSQIGKEENPRGSNWGKAGDPVPGYLGSVGINFPASWCMAFMYWCYNQASAALGVPNPMLKTGGVLTGWEGRPRNHVKLPLPGDVFIMDLGHGLGHTGIIESIDPDGTLHTIEGNTNDTGSREGYEVARKVRHNQKPIIGYLRF
jgi:hypothetical protein